MKSRSHHRLPISDPPDDWVDGSWTVDCVCGVNFDDGEEMVNCDECGVWVHTRCSRYVKSDKSFACDKCKIKNTTSRNDSEETEVAQLLVELPTKTLRMDNPYASSCLAPPTRPFRLWTDIPMEERVHVQGIPGGDPHLFGGLSSVFGPKLWKCTGYVPKKFNFQYREFPCWDEKQDGDKKYDEENENAADKGAGVLFSLSKSYGLPTPVGSSAGTKKIGDEADCDRPVHFSDMKQHGSEDVDAKNDAKKDRSLRQPILADHGQHNKEDLGTPYDHNGKKKARAVDEEEDSKKSAAHASKAVPTDSSDAKLLEFFEGSGFNGVKIDAQGSKNDYSTDTAHTDALSDDNHMVGKDVGKYKNNIASGEESPEASSSDRGRHNSSNEASPKQDRVENQVPVGVESSPKTDDCAAPSLDHNDSWGAPIAEEALEDVNANGEGSKSFGIDLHKIEPLVEDLPKASPELTNIEVKAEVDLDNLRGVSNVPSSPPGNLKLDCMKPLAQQAGMPADDLFKDVKMVDAAIVSLHSSNHKVQDVDSSTLKVGDCQANRADESPNDPFQPKGQLVGSESSMVVWKSSSELKHCARPAEEPMRLGSTILNPTGKSSQRKIVVSVGKSSSTLQTHVVSKSSVSDNHRSASARNHNSSAKQKGVSDCNVSSKKDSALSHLVKVEDRRETPKKIVRDLSKSSASSALKTSNSSMFSHASVSKQTLSDSKDPLVSSSSKTSSAQNIAPAPDSRESGSSSQTESASHLQNKTTASNLPHRGEKTNQTNCQPSCKVNHAPPMHPSAPSNSPATLSDEELALLLHQELNSSPRVPRVPRMRNNGNLPQLASPTGTSMLMKRTSSSGAKDHGLVPRRKYKDFGKDGSQSYRDIDDEAKKLDKVPSSSDQRRRNSACTPDPVNKREMDNGSTKEVRSAMKNIPPASTATVSSGPSSSTEVNEQNFSSSRNSPQHASDDDVDTVGRPTHRTLPGLLAEIMSKGRRMTYEELCNAVLPHWPHLRKHNGERYAYSSHSQAVLDCLRNRNEWAQLVDRGPKTNASRKRRKVDANPSSFESEDNEDSKNRTAQDVEGKSFESHREEFPKGKRKARKRRRLTLQGRGVKDVRRRRKADVISDDDSGSFSDSSEESMFSEDEVQGRWNNKSSWE